MTMLVLSDSQCCQQQLIIFIVKADIEKKTLFNFLAEIDPEFYLQPVLFVFFFLPEKQKS